MKSNWKKLSVVAGIGAALLLTTAVVVFSQGPPRERGFRHGPGHDGPGHRGGPFADLNLTEDQKAQIEKIRDSFRESEKALHDQMRTLHEGQPDPMNQFNEAAFRAAAEARAKVQVEMEVLHARMMSQISGVLTAEQRAKFAERHQHMRRTGPPPPPPPPPGQPM